MAWQRQEGSVTTQVQHHIVAILDVTFTQGVLWRIDGCLGLQPEIYSQNPSKIKKKYLWNIIFPNIVK